MENFATKNQEELITKLKSAKLEAEQELSQKIGITRQFIRDEIDGILKAIIIVQKCLDDLRAM